jgi:alpha-1,6-mannosyltransferase
MRSPWLSFATAAAAVFTSFVALSLLPDWNKSIPVFLAIFFFAFFAYLFAARFALRAKWNQIPRISFYIFLVAIACRLLIFWKPTYLSDDIYRYFWDGRVQAAGFGPYDYPPEAKELSFLRDDNFHHLTYLWLKTNYPPAAETIFHLLAMPQSFLFFKFGILCFDFLLIEIIRRLLIRENLSPAHLLIYAWHPLAAVEFGSSAHMDVIGISLFMTSYLLVLRGSRKTAGGITLALAVLTKYIPIFSVPWMIRKAGWKFTALFLISLAALTLPFYTSDLRMLDGLLYYYRKWRFNDSLFGLLYIWLGGAEPARKAGMIAVFISAAYCWIARYSFYRAMIIVFGVIILFSPVVHPWYVCWLIPLLVFHRNAGWHFFTGWIALAYLIIHFFPVGVWKQQMWLKLVIYVPLFVALLADWFWNLRQRRAMLPANASPSNNALWHTADHEPEKRQQQNVRPEHL